MTFPLPAWTSVPPGSAPAVAFPDGWVLAMVASRRAHDAGWAAEVAAEVARGWSEAGARVVLADAGLTYPQLHDALGLGSREGLVDALRWGASVRRVSHRPSGDRFFAITAGTAVADGASLLEDPRWPALCQGFQEAGVTLALLVPEHDPCRAGVLSQASHLLVISEPGEDVAALVEPWDGEVLAVLGRAQVADGSGPATPTEDREVPEETQPPEAEPDQPDAPEAEPDQPEAPEATPDQPDATDATAAPGDPDGTEAPEPTMAGEPTEALPDPLFMPAPPPEAPEPDRPADDEAEEAWSDPLLEVPDPIEAEPASPATVAPPAPVPTFEEIVEDTEDAALATGSSSGRPGWLGLLLVFLAVVATAVAAWLGYLPMPWGSEAEPVAYEEPVNASPAPSLAAPPPAEVREPMPFSLGLASFQDEATAAGLMDQLREQVPGVLFITAPVTVQGNVVHRVLAGPLADSAGAVALAARIATEAGLDAGGWVARWTPLAFQLGEMADQEAALRRTEVLVGLGIPAYRLAVPYSDGSLRFRVYAGAYADAQEASYLSALLDERGLSSASLSDRTGRLPE